MVKWNMEAVKKKARKIPRMTYVLMFFLAFYMIYIIGKMIGGLSDPDISGVYFVYAAIGVFSLIGIAFAVIGGWALFTKNYAEEWPEEDSAKDDENQELPEEDEIES